MFDSGDSTQAPRATTSGVLAGVAESEWSEVLRGHHAAIARAQFLEVDAIAMVYLARCAEDEQRGCNEAFQGEFANAEIGFVYRWTEAAAQRVIGLGIDLRWRLRATSKAFESGDIDQVRAQAISDALANVSPDKVDLIEQLLLDGSASVNTAKLRAKARHLINRHDPDGATNRRAQAEDDRDIRLRANEDGTCSIEGTLPGPGARVVAMRLRAMCFEVCGRDPRTFAQRRADALVALAAGATTLVCRCEHPDCSATGTARMQDSVVGIPAPLHGEPDAPDVDAATGGLSAAPHDTDHSPSTPDRPTIPAARRRTTAPQAGLPVLPPATVHVGVNLTTLLGLDDLPGFLAGHGSIDADLAREIAGDGTWRRVLTLSDADREHILDALCGHAGRAAPAQTSGPKPSAHQGNRTGFAQNSGDPVRDGSGTERASHGSSATPLSDELWLSGRRVDTLPHGRILGIGRALAAAGITPATIRERTRHRRAELTYRPSARLAEIVRTRDGTCRFPGCTARASGCDLDHTIPFDHTRPESGGLTVEQNLACLCRRHHRLKTVGVWTVRQIGAGRLEWTSPTGEPVVTEPAGAFDDDRSTHEALAATYGLTLTDPLTVERLFGEHRGRGVVDDLSYLVDLNAPGRGTRHAGRDAGIPLREVHTAVSPGEIADRAGGEPPF